MADRSPHRISSLARRHTWSTLTTVAIGSAAVPMQSPAVVQARHQVWHVGPNRELRSIAEAARRARDGDTVQVDAGDYRRDSAIWIQDHLCIRAMGGRVRLLAEGAAAEGKAIWVVRGGRIEIEGFDFSGARVPAGNGAGIRFESGRLTLKNCRFLDNEMGLLSAGRPEMQLAVYGCAFGDAPRHDSGTLHHLLYVGAIDQCVVMHSRFFNGWRGHLLKSRARINRILWNDLSDGSEGEASYELEFPEGGDNLVQGNRIEQSARSQNPALLSMGAEAQGRFTGRLVLRDNHFVNHGANSTEQPARFVHLWPGNLAGPMDVLAEGNTFEGPGLRGLPER